MLMKRSIILPALVLGLAGAMAGVPAFADDVLYDNTVSGTSYQGQGTVVYAYGSKITDSFNLSSASTVTGITLGIEYTYPLDPLDSVTWAITDLASGGVTGSGTTATVLAAGTATSFIETPKGNNSYEASFSIDSLDLSSGTYWLEIDNMAGMTEMATPTPSSGIPVAAIRPHIGRTLIRQSPRRPSESWARVKQLRRSPRAYCCWAPDWRVWRRCSNAG
jgi:hypothetical protein